MYCSRCGVPIDDDATVCPHCGLESPKLKKQFSFEIEAEKEARKAERKAKRAAEKERKNKELQKKIKKEPLSRKKWKTTMLLCLFLGYFGIHRFYVKKTATGVLYFFTLGLFGIGWIVDFIEILCRSFRDKQGLRVVN